MGRIPEKAGEVGVVPGSPGENNLEVGWGRPQLPLGPLCPPSCSSGPGWAVCSGREGQWGWSVQSCWL